MGSHGSSGSDSHVGVIASFKFVELSLAGSCAALFVVIVALGPLNNFPFDTDAVVSVRAALLLQAANARILNEFLKPWRTCTARFGDQACEYRLVIAARQKAKLAQQRLVIVQQAAYSQ